ncbi:uncharacterized protein LOC143905372 [Temnothorax americanus]|uniref:uncharacterized protein LOC143905372 n=1 Tax=Temnothorax americanus TaxID=1964332 RepID=UPI004068247E
MGSLLSPRVTILRAFAHTGVDYAGPILPRTSRGRGHKAYKGFIALFVCLCTKAVHLEAASDLTTDAFLAALRRFTARRELCAVIYSDRGTNFVGADKELRSFLQAAIMEDSHWKDSLASEGIAWRLNPPAAPHMGGLCRLWEAAVKSVKHHLRRVIGDSTLTFEELSTLLAQVEACLNSRPLQAMSDDPEDLTALTHGHFLIEAALKAVPEPTLTTTTTVSRWQHLQQMREHFWRRWSTEYLQTLQARTKWQTPINHAKVGDLCLIRNELTPPNRWPLARITAIYPTTMTRPVAKIVLLPCEDQQP